MLDREWKHWNLLPLFNIIKTLEKNSTMFNYFNYMFIAQFSNLLGHEIRQFCNIYVFVMSWETLQKTLMKPLHSAVICSQKQSEIIVGQAQQTAVNRKKQCEKQLLALSQSTFQWTQTTGPVQRTLSASSTQISIPGNRKKCKADFL